MKDIQQELPGGRNVEDCTYEPGVSWAVSGVLEIVASDEAEYRNIRRKNCTAHCRAETGGANLPRSQVDECQLLKPKCFRFQSQPFTSSPSFLKASSYLTLRSSSSILSATLRTFALRRISFVLPTSFQNHLASRCASSVHAQPVLPARAVLPTRWTYVDALVGTSYEMTCSRSGTSRPREARSVATRMEVLPCRKECIALR